MRQQTRVTCDSEVELSTLASGMAKQHERYQDALQELIDNSVSSVVKDESYFDNPETSVEIVVTLRRTENTVRTTVADNGPGISREALQNEIFQTGNKKKSDGILNNVGWGLKASLAWFEETLSQANPTPEDEWFTLVTQTSGSGRYRVDGPITGNLPISRSDDNAWVDGLGIGDHSLGECESGTHIHISCSRPKFDNDVWPSAKSLEIKAQTLRELLGVKFRRLLAIHPENEIHIDYEDETNGKSGSLSVVPIFPEYVSDDQDPPTPYAEDSFEIEGDDGAVYEVEFERGTIDFDAMTSDLADSSPGLFTTSGRFRTRFRPNQSKQGVDIYANGRILMTSVFTDIFDLTRNNEYNYFGGEVRIFPKKGTDEVPTDNKKVRVDTNSALWQNLCEILSGDKYQPEGKRYDEAYVEPRSETESTTTGRADPTESSTGAADIDPSIKNSSISARDELFELHQQDSRRLEETLRRFEDVPDEGGFVDATLTSPPYFDLKDYGYEAEEQLGQGSSYDKYLEEMREVFQQVYNITKDSGTLWVVVNTFKNNGEIVQLPNDIASICQNLSGIEQCPECSSSLRLGQPNHQLTCRECDYTHNRKSDSWLLQDIVIWNKTRALPYNSDGQFRNVFEYILCFSKTDSFEFDVDKTRIADPTQFKQWWVEYPERYHPRGKAPNNIWEHVTPPQGSFGSIESLDHPAPFPTALVERILRLTTKQGSIVHDPFAGSGTVPAVADIMGRRSIGFELSPKYCEAYDSVKEEISEKYGDQLRSQTTEQQENLAKVIGGLRQIKHIRELLRKHGKEANGASHDDLTIHTAFHLCRDINVSFADKDRLIDSDIYYIVDDDLDQELQSNLQQSLRSIAANGISASYGINPAVNVYSTSEFLEQAITRSERSSIGDLYVYEEGRHYDYKEKISLSDWVERAVGTNKWQQAFAQKEWPPIVSNVGLSVDNPRRGGSQEGDRDDAADQIEILGIDDLALS